MAVRKNVNRKICILLLPWGYYCKPPTAMFFASDFLNANFFILSSDDNVQGTFDFICYSALG